MTSNTVRIPKLDNYIIAEKLGSGSYADVYKAFSKGKKREIVAVKCVLKSSLSKTAIDNLIQEIGLLKKLNHENIVEMKDFTWDDHFIYIIMEYCSGGDLSHFIKSRQRLPEEICQTFLQQIASAMQYMRGKNISHLDLKPQNILLCDRKRNAVRIADFGLAQPMEESDIDTKIKGSPLYMAPEILIDKKYNPKVDLWSIGVILYECLFGKAPYSSKSFEELVNKIISGTPITLPVGTSISPECKDLLKSCLERDVNKRIDFDGFFNHKFIDLEHKPSPENMTKASDILSMAVNYDACKEYNDAVKCYVDALRYLIPIMKSESDSVKRLALRKKIQEYLSRTEILKKNLDPDAIENIPELKLPSMPSVKQPKPIQRPSTANNQELLKLVSTTPQIIDGLDIAKSAELYEQEKSYKIALEKYELALSKLIPLLQNEPTSRRKELLHAEVTRFMTQAENVKEALEGKVKGPVEESVEVPVADIEKSCSLQ